MAFRPASSFSRHVRVALVSVAAWRLSRPDAGFAIAMAAAIVAVGFCMLLQEESPVEIYIETQYEAPNGECASSAREVFSACIMYLFFSEEH
jgi:di/tricarboxylate transporter